MDEKHHGGCAAGSQRQCWALQEVRNARTDGAQHSSEAALSKTRCVPGDLEGIEGRWNRKQLNSLLLQNFSKHGNCMYSGELMEAGVSRMSLCSKELLLLQVHVNTRWPYVLANYTDSF